MSNFELGIIGAGNMAGALIGGAIRGNYLDPSRLVAADPSPERRQHFQDTLGVKCVESNAAAAEAPRILLAVKPQVMSDVLDEIAPHVAREALVISIAAGVRTSFIDEKLSRRGRIVRVMPNTPMLVGEGISAVAPGPRASSAELKWTDLLLAASGKTVRVEAPQMDAVTAVSGSGPAYFFYLIEAMIAAGEAEGLSHQTARELAVHTCTGAGRLLQETRRAPEDLRAAVTSPNGTTQRAIETLNAAGVKDKLIDAVRSAAARSRELGR